MGSSRSSTFGSARRALTTSTSCRSASERLPAGTAAGTLQLELLELPRRPGLHVAVGGPAGSGAPRGRGSRPRTSRGPASRSGRPCPGRGASPRPRRPSASGRPPISTEPSSGARNPLAIPSSVDFPDPFSPTSAWISPARQSTLTSRTACTGAEALETPRSESTTGVAGPGVVDISSRSGARESGVCSVLLSTLRIHPRDELVRDERGDRRLGRPAGDAQALHRVVLERDREHDRRRWRRSP